MIDKIRRLAEIATLSTWALFGACIVLTVLHVLAVLMLWLGTMPEARWLEPGDTIAIICILLGLDLMAAIFALAKARIAAKGPGSMGFDLSSGGTDAPPAPAAGTKITVETTKP